MYVFHFFRKDLSLICLLCCTFFACQTDDDTLSPDSTTPQVVANYPGVDQALWTHFAEFEAEALKRDIVIDLRSAQITGRIAEIEETHVAGQCTYNSHQPNAILIDLSFWNQAPHLYREFVVFHELGHCQLFRGHDETVNPDGSCESLMRSGAEECFDNYTAATRTRYLNELFGVMIES